MASKKNMFSALVLGGVLIILLAFLKREGFYNLKANGHPPKVVAAVATGQAKTVKGP